MNLDVFIMFVDNVGQNFVCHFSGFYDVYQDKVLRSYINNSKAKNTIFKIVRIFLVIYTNFWWLNIFSKFKLKFNEF